MACILLQALKNYIISTVFECAVSVRVQLDPQTSLCYYKQLKLNLAAHSTGQEHSVPWNTSSCFLASLEGKM